MVFKLIDLGKYSIVTVFEILIEEYLGKVGEIASRLDYESYGLSKARKQLLKLRFPFMVTCGHFKSHDHCW